MTFNTPIDIPHATREISYADRLLLVGSCFTEHISAHLKSALFRVSANPFGIQYNPLSIFETLQFLQAPEPNTLPEENILFDKGLWHSMWHHGDFSKPDKETFERGIAESIRSGRKALQEANVVILTFGTAWVYEKDGRVVANCHKLPAHHFTRRRLSVEEIVEQWEPFLKELTADGKEVILTVSPIRHLKDGLHENQLSKATLLLAVERLCGQANVSYFPAYEIVLDELRDYRYYAADMLHPSEVAAAYVWERFCETYFSQTIQAETVEMQRLYKQFQHRSIHADTAEWQQFVLRREQLLKTTAQQYPWVRKLIVDN